METGIPGGQDRRKGDRRTGIDNRKGERRAGTGNVYPGKMRGEVAGGCRANSRQIADRRLKDRRSGGDRRKNGNR